MRNTKLFTPFPMSTRRLTVLPFFLCALIMLLWLRTSCGLVRSGSRIGQLARTEAYCRKDEQKQGPEDKAESKISTGFVFDERTDTERGTFKLGASNTPSPFRPPSELSSGPRTGGDGDKVVLFTCITLALLVQFFLTSNRDAPSFDSYVPISERVKVEDEKVR